MSARTRLLLSLSLCLAVAGCASGAALSPTPALSGPSSLSVAVASNDFPAGKPRIPFVLFKGADPLRDVSTVTLQAFDLSSGTAVPGWSGEAVGYTDYDTPYWLAYPDLPHAGYWGLAATIRLADGAEQAAEFTVQVEKDASGPEIGEAAPLSRNRTLTTEPDLKKLTSDPQPETGLYQLTVADAVRTGKPTVVTFATPAFCTSRLCAPVVNSVKQVYAQVGPKANFIHIEVYKSFDPLVYADEMDEWHLASEPWTFVLDSQGKVAARLGGPLSPRELTDALAPLLEP